MAVKVRLHPTMFLVLIPIVVTSLTVYITGWRWDGMARGIAPGLTYWFLRAAPLPNLLFGPIAGLLTVAALPLHRRRLIAMSSLLCFLAGAGFYVLREYGRLAPLVEAGAVTWDQALSYLDMFAVAGTVIGYMITAISARISTVVPDPVKRARRGALGGADWLSMPATGKLFPPDGEIVVGERYRVDRELGGIALAVRPGTAFHPGNH